MTWATLLSILVPILLEAFPAIAEMIKLFIKKIFPEQEETVELDFGSKQAFEKSLKEALTKRGTRIRSSFARNLYYRMVSFLVSRSEEIIKKIDPGTEIAHDEKTSFATAMQSSENFCDDETKLLEWIEKHI